jgi:hypothetical protein
MCPELVQPQRRLDGTSRKGNALGSLSEPGLLHWIRHVHRGDTRGDLFNGVASRNVDGRSDLFLGCWADIYAAAVPTSAAIPASKGKLCAYEEAQTGPPRKFRQLARACGGLGLI